MSEPMKTHHTKSEITIQINKKKNRTFLVPNDWVAGVIRLLQNFEITETSEPKNEVIESKSSAASVLKAARIKAGLSQINLAKLLGIPQSYVTDMESGKHPIEHKMAMRLGKSLNVEFGIFLV